MHMQKHLHLPRRLQSHLQETTDGALDHDGEVERDGEVEGDGVGGGGFMQ
jgi:hypothetical protein